MLWAASQAKDPWAVSLGNLRSLWMRFESELNACVGVLESSCLNFIFLHDYVGGRQRIVSALLSCNTKT